MNELVALALEEAGSVRGAARETGINERLFQRWKHGRAAPSPKSERRIRMWLERDTPQAREHRLRNYELRAALGRPLFD